MMITRIFQRPQQPQPHEEKLNTIWSAITHGIGLGLAVIGLVLLIRRAIALQSPLRLVTFTIYGSCLILLYLFSTLYHSLLFTKARHVFQIFDHSSIFLLIAGTYTPYTLVAIGGKRGWLLFSLVWLLAIIGIIYKVFTVGRHPIFETCLYILMGWLIITAAKPLLATIGPQGLGLLIAGGVVYTLGALLYSMRGVRYIHIIWHVFVMIGSFLMFWSIYLYV